MRMARALAWIGGVATTGCVVGTTPPTAAPNRSAPIAASVQPAQPTAPPDGDDDLARRLRALPHPTESGWDRAVARALIAAYDADASGVLDLVAEIRAVTCDAWHAIDDAAQSERGFPIATTYGFGEDYGWVGSALGFAESHRPVVADAAQACGLELDSDTGFDPTADYDGTQASRGGGRRRPSNAGAGAGTGTAHEIEVATRSTRAGSGEWDDIVKQLMVRAYDRDQSGQLDDSAEVAAISCRVLAALDAGVPGIVAIYGVAPGYGWVGHVIGIAEPMRGDLYARFQACGMGR